MGVGVPQLVSWGDEGPSGCGQTRYHLDLWHVPMQAAALRQQGQEAVAHGQCGPVSTWVTSHSSAALGLLNEHDSCHC